jgi:hypothetical protein
MYGMKKTTVYLPEKLKFRLALAARHAGKSEADLIREGVEFVVERELTPPPRGLPAFNSGLPGIAHRVDEELAKGFGED